MKTLKKGTKVIRAKESEVNRFIADGFEFCPKSEWKNLKTKPTKKAEETTEVVETAKKKKRKK